MRGHPGPRRNTVTGPLVVQQSFPAPRDTSNPYIRLLADALRTHGVEVRTFSWRGALFGRYDVFHAHWPEILVGGASPAKATVRQLLFALLLLKLRVQRIPLVRTRHNVELPDGLSRTQRWLLRRAERQTALVVVLNEHTPVGDGVERQVVLHGHYRDWYLAFPAEAADPGRVLFFGLIRRYKGVGELLRAFAATDPDVGLTLRIAGRPSSPELAEQMQRAAADDPRITVSLRYQTDPELTTEITRAQLVVLPYPEMHNSGSVLAALSLDRPVLVPDNPVNRSLAAAVGPGWVQTFAGSLTAEDITRALAAAPGPDDAPPDLSARDWPSAARQHVDAYERAVTTARRR